MTPLRFAWILTAFMQSKQERMLLNILSLILENDAASQEAASGTQEMLLTAFILLLFEWTCFWLETCHRPSLP